MKRFSSPLQYLKDEEGCIAYGGVLEFYEAGTSTPKPVYIVDDDPNSETGFQEFGHIVEVDGFGLIPDVFGDGVYKVIAKDKDGVTLWERDNIDFSSVAQVVEEVAITSAPNINLLSNSSLKVIEEEQELAL